MRHYVELEPGHRAVEGGASVEAELILHQEEDHIFDDHTACDLQCGDSLAIAVDRIGGGSFGMNRLRWRGLARGGGIASTLACLVPPGSSLPRRSKERP